MFYFDKEQKVFNIGDFHFGGQPGENATVLFGGIRKLSETSREELREQAELSKRFGIPASVDLFIRKPEQIEERIGFVAAEAEGPFLLDLPFKQIALKEAALEYVSRHNLQERVIYNSINFATDEEEIGLLKKHGIRSAVLLTVDMSHVGSDGSLNLLQNQLIPRAEMAGIENLLVDPGTMPFDSGNASGEVLRSIMAIKSETGLPCGCAMINLAESWRYFNEATKEVGYREAISSLNSAAQLVGADFLIYGPLSLAKYVFPSAAMMDKLVSEANEGYFGLKPRSEGHPRYRQ